MCGIAGRFSPQARLEPNATMEVAAMTQSVLHRGPDAGGIVDRTPLAVLGHRRLAIIDLKTGQQPMSGVGGRFWITFNGEIYNYRRLRDELVGDYDFQTDSDTEVILAAFAKWGDRCVERLEGMFSFALLDTRERTLFLARDHVGKKPLYLRWRRGILDFASELSALTAATDWQGEFDSTAWAFYLRLGYVPSPWSIYNDVEKLRPGECCVVDASGVHKRRYWDPATVGVNNDYSEEEAVEAIDAELRAAVTDRLMSEVPLGAFLSGGIDSGLVVSLLSEQLGPGVKTITASFDGEPGELEAASQVAQHLHTDHQEVLVTPRVEELVRQLPRHFGEPFADSSAIPTWYVSKAAKEHVTVALTGDGGDEPFGGYDFRYFPHQRDAKLRACLPSWFRRSIMRWLARVWPDRHDLPRVLRLSTVFRNIAIDEDAAFYADLCFTAPSLASELAPDIAAQGEAVEEHIRQVYRAGADGDAFGAIMRADVGFYMTEDVLVKVDRMSMAHGLEVRSPLLSKRVIELALSIPSRIKTRPGVSKHLLRKLAGRYLPAEVRNLPKRGFHMPIDNWFRTALRKSFEDSLFSAGSDLGWIDRERARAVWLQHLNGSHNHGMTLWALWSLKSWLDGLRTSPPATTEEETVELVRQSADTPG